MKAIVIDEFGGVDKLKLVDVPKPVPEPNEVLIEIFYTAVNPVDWKIREGYLKERLPHKFPLIPGWDAAGKIAAIGKNVHNFNIGDEVYAYCRKPIVQFGTYAEFIAFDAENVAKKPKTLNFAEAAAIPLVGLTAWQALFDSAHLKSGETILIQGGAGGVGGMAIQFAKYAKAKVLTTASLAKHPYVKKLGADFAINYKEGFVEEVKKIAPDGVDVLFDLIGGKTLMDSLPLIKPKGRQVGIVESLDPAIAAKYDISANYVFVRPNGKELTEIGKLIDEGKVVVPDIEEMALKDAAAAQEKSKQGHSQGKIVLKVK